MRLRTFVLRVGLMPRSRGGAVHGVVEVVDTGAREPFENAQELWTIVAGTRPISRRVSRAEVRCQRASWLDEDSKE